jgi:hypothetical protein
MIEMKFKKRIRGTPKQIGKPFPIGEKKKLPKLPLSLMKETLPRRLVGKSLRNKILELTGDLSVPQFMKTAEKVRTGKIKTINRQPITPRWKQDILKLEAKIRKKYGGEPKVTPESERASEWYAKKYPLMFRGGGKRAAYYGGKAGA